MKQAKQKTGDQVLKPVKFSISTPLYTELQDLLRATTCRNFSELLRQIIEGKVIPAQYYDQQPDKLQQQLQDYCSSITNMNEKLSKILHHLQSQSAKAPELVRADLMELNCLEEKLAELSLPLLGLVTKIAARWLQGNPGQDSSLGVIPEVSES